MKREEIKEIVEGITKEQLDKIMEINGNDIEKAKANLGTLEEKVKSLEAQLDERDSQLSDLKNEAKENEKLKTKITELETKNATTKTDYENRIKALEADHEVENKLRDAKAKNVKAVKALLDSNSETDIDAQIKALQENEATAFLFDTTSNNQTPPPTGTSPNGGNGGGEPKNKPTTLSEAVSKALNMKG